MLVYSTASTVPVSTSCDSIFLLGSTNVIIYTQIKTPIRWIWVINPVTVSTYQSCNERFKSLWRTRMLISLSSLLDSKRSSSFSGSSWKSHSSSMVFPTISSSSTLKSETEKIIKQMIRYTLLMGSECFLGSCSKELREWSSQKIHK